MSYNQPLNFTDVVKDHAYPGRGIVIGKSADASSAVIAYFIMGRSANSQNRIFVEENDDVIIHPHKPELVEDPSLIIYAPIRTLGENTIVTNGDQTDTIYDGLCNNESFSQALTKRCFEPDAPNYTPRISGMVSRADGDFSYQMSILKSADQNGSDCSRYTYTYPALAGYGHFIHTYQANENPLPSFEGEPRCVSIPNDIESFTQEIWNALNAEYKISLYVRYIDLKTGTITNRMINKNK